MHVIKLFVRMKEENFRNFDSEEFKYEEIDRTDGVRGTFTAIAVTEIQFLRIIQIFDVKK